MATRPFTRSLQYMMVVAALGASDVLARSEPASPCGAIGPRGRSACDAVHDDVGNGWDRCVPVRRGADHLLLCHHVRLRGRATGEGRSGITTWAWVKGVGELKHTLIEVILVYLVVGLHHRSGRGGAPLSWQTLVIPLAIVLIACALRLLGPGYSPGDRRTLPRASTGTPT
jgi:hypothetical protein